MQAKDAVLDFKELEHTRGFFVHLQRLYPVLTPFLKGMHLTLDGWRINRDDQMWKLPRDEWVDLGTTAPLPQSPAQLIPAPWLRNDLEVLQSLLAPSVPPFCLIQPSQSWEIVYSFADASSAGFGSSYLLPNDSIWFRFGALM